MKIIKNGRVRITDYYVARLEGSGEEIVQQLQGWSDYYGVPLHDIVYDCYDGEASITYWRDLTEAEKAAEAKKKAKTAERAKKIKETKEANERKEYERLKKKYG